MSQNTYSKEFKAKAVEAYYAGSGTYIEVARKMNISSPCRVKDWVKKKKEMGEKAFDIEKRGRPKLELEKKN